MWQYLVRELEEGEEEHMSLLNALGKSGWELVAVQKVGLVLWAYLKKPVELSPVPE